VGQEQTRARPTKRPPQSKSLPRPKHMETISMSIQKHSDLLRRLGLTNTFMLLCSHQTTFRVNLLPQSSYLVAGITKLTTRAY
jgi:hypothetical protein